MGKWFVGDGARGGRKRGRQRRTSGDEPGWIDRIEKLRTQSERVREKERKKKREKVKIQDGKMERWGGGRK